MLIPRTCRYAAQCGERDFAQVAKRRISRRGGHPGLSLDPHAITRALEGEPGGSKAEKVTCWWEQTGGPWPQSRGTGHL